MSSENPFQGIGGHLALRVANEVNQSVFRRPKLTPTLTQAYAVINNDNSHFQGVSIGVQYCPQIGRQKAFLNNGFRQK
jgi:hypothetical protein